MFLPPLLMPKPTFLITFLLRVLMLVQVLLHTSLTLSHSVILLLIYSVLLNKSYILFVNYQQTCTSAGPDGISSKMLKSTAHSVSHPLSLLFNLFWNLPIWMQMLTYNSYYEIYITFITIMLSLLSLVSRLLEKHIFYGCTISGLKIAFSLLVSLVFARL